MDHLIKEKSKVGFGVWSRVAINIRSSSKAMTRSIESSRGYRLLDEDDAYQLVQKLYSLLQSRNDLRVVSHTLLDFNMGLVAKGECGTRDAKYSPGPVCQDDGNSPRAQPDLKLINGGRGEPLLSPTGPTWARRQRSSPSTPGRLFQCLLANFLSGCDRC